MTEEPDSESEWLTEQRDEARRLCRILYRNPIGWECGDGWNAPLAKLSYTCEMLNLQFYPKYGVRIQAEQIKEKYGTLRFYYSVVIDPPAWLDVWRRPFAALADFLRRKIDYRYKTVTDVPRHIRHEFEEITEEEYRDGINRKFKASNVEYADYGSIKVKVTHYDIYAKTHTEPTQHRFLHMLMKASEYLSRILNFRGWYSPSVEQTIIARYLDGKCEELAKKAEDECYGVCERCGNQFGEYNQRCETAGWISYVCERHIRPGERYTKNGKTLIRGNDETEESDEE